MIKIDKRYLLLIVLLLIPAVGASEIKEQRSIQEDLGDITGTPGSSSIEATVNAMYDSVPVPPTMPLQGATVTAKKVFGMAYHCVTGGNGKCTMYVTPGFYFVTAKKDGFISVTMRFVRARPNDISQVSLLLVEESASELTQSSISQSNSQSGSQSSSQSESQSTAGGQSSSLI
ncbi:carboxypeptidase-like regulatory domain-containing protein [archaeon]|nr:carboxypeptidase-like regulatory domain-containing protein [archaeon]